MDFYDKSISEAVKELKTDASSGLSESEAAKRLRVSGSNTLTESGGKNILVRFVSQFKDLMVIILLIAAAISFFVSRMQGDRGYIDSVIILVIVTLNAVVGTIQEVRADKAIEALKEMSSPHAVVVRGGKRKRLDSSALVLGDLVVLRAGDLVPADIRLIKAEGLKAEESALTGESRPVKKEALGVFQAQTPVAERKNMLFSASAVISGAGVGIVTATGMQTQVGRIAAMIQGEEAPQTPLQTKLKEVGKVLGLGAVIICAVIFVLGLFQKADPLEMFMISISLAVAAIPEGLPAVVTIVLAVGIRKMAQKRAIVRHLPAVETLGGTQVICSDKTGTLTQNRMTVVKAWTLKGETPPESGEAQALLEACVLCSDYVKSQESAPGDPTEAALAAACEKSREELCEQLPRCFEIPFNSERKMMTTVHRAGNGYLVMTKGAPDVLIGHCARFDESGRTLRMTAEIKHRILLANEAFARGTLRVIAVAGKNVETPPENESQAENSLVFMGLVGMEDPPRASAKKSVSLCKKAGILPVMITGDHAQTAFSIGKRLGIAEDMSEVMTGRELDGLTEKELAGGVSKYRIFARVSPEHKVRIVKAWQANGKVTAMTGDGVNDAPALKCADIGCAMGKSGTEVAKSAADMVLTDDDFSTIVTAVKEGRGIYKNIRKAIHFLVSCNIGEILVVFAAFLLRNPAPLLAIQLLWVNVVTDSLPALALGSDPVEECVMEEKPHGRGESIFSGGMGISIVLEGMLIGALALLAYTVGRLFFDADPSEPLIGRTMGFAVLSLSQLVHSFNMRSERSLFSVGVFSNKRLAVSFLICASLMIGVIVLPPLAAVFKTVPLTTFQWLIVSVLALFPFAAVELEKRIFK